MYKRILDIQQILLRKSIFLFGPRQTGKSTWLKKNFPEALYINLLSKRVFDDYSLKPNALQSDIEIFHRKSESHLIIIDEVQKLPHLLDEVHNQIEDNKKLRFILTGSSARKLKREGVNLLGGRASWRNMFPLVYPEIKEKLKTVRDLESRILKGGLPNIFDSQEPMEDLDDYVQLYLNEEIKAEGFVRNYEAFNRFLLTSALVNTKQINFTEVGNDSQIPPRTVHDYFQILEDTLVGHLLPPFLETPSRKAMASAKFYFFDTGVVNALLGRTSIHAGTPEFGELFEQYIFTEIKAFNSYKNKKAKLYYWRSTSQFEVDLVIRLHQGQLIIIEIKSKSVVVAKDFKGLQAFSEDFPDSKKIMITLEGRHFIEKNKIEIIPALQFLEMLWNDEIF